MDSSSPRPLVLGHPAPCFPGESSPAAGGFVGDLGDQVPPGPERPHGPPRLGHGGVHRCLRRRVLLREASRRFFKGLLDCCSERRVGLGSDKNIPATDDVRWNPGNPQAGSLRLVLQHPVCVLTRCQGPVE